MVEIESRKAALIAEIEISRAEMRGAIRRCEANLDPAVVVRKSIVKAPAQWLSSAVVVGLLLSRFVRTERGSTQGGGTVYGGGDSNRGDLFRRDKRSFAKEWFFPMGRVAFDLLKPLITNWVTDRLSELARAKATEAFTKRPASGTAPRT